MFFGDAFVALLFQRGSFSATDNEAVTEYVDHAKPVGVNLANAGFGEGAHNEKRLYSAWFGSGHEIKAQAWNILQATVA